MHWRMYLCINGRVRKVRSCTVDGCVTIEYRVGDKATRIERLGLVICRAQGFAVAVFECVGADIFALELVRVETLHVSPMVLVEVGKFVIHENRRFEVDRYMEADYTLQLGKHITVGAVVDQSILRSSDSDTIDARAKPIVVLVGGDVSEVGAGSAICRCSQCIAVRIVERHLSDERRAPDEEPTNRSK